MTTSDDPVTVSVENLGGIDELSVTLQPGVTVLTGRNATNRTSLLRSIAAALGGSAGELKAGADAGRVELAVGEESYTRRLERTDGAVRTTGEPYTDDAALVDSYSCLLATNPAREAVERGDGAALREVIMAPIDTAEIRAEIDRRQREVRALSEDLAEAGAELDRLPDLRDRLAARRDERDSVVSELESVREAVEAADLDAGDAEDAEAVVEELRSVREEFEAVADRLETQRTSIESLEDERETVAGRLEAVDAPRADLEDATDDLEALQGRRRELENRINNLVSIVEFNEDLVEEAAGALPGEGAPAGGESGDGAVVDALDPSSETVKCWTCGTTVERSAVAERVDDLRAVIDEQRRERNELRTEIADQREYVSGLREDVREHESLAADLEEIDAEIERRAARVDDLEARADDLRDRIEELEAEAAESERLRDSDLLERYRRLSELEYERGQLDEAVESLEAEIESVEAERDRRDRLEGEIEAHRAELEDLRSKIADVEREAVETFNDHAATVLERLGYDNVERVWIERKTDAAADELAPESAFDLHVVRSTPAGSVYDDTAAHLSESERAVVGLVVALAGYLVHDVHERVPFVLLDSLEAIDAERIADLVEYFAEYAPYLVVALLPEDARALPDRFDRVRTTEAVV
ncbi:MAG: archaea-specific SMC-related protein [Halosimplex sp.]